MDKSAGKDLRDWLHDHLNSLLKGFTFVQIAMALGVGVGLVLKLTNTPGQQLVFVVFMSVLAFLFLLQIGISFAYVYTHGSLAFLGGFSSMSLALGLVTLIFKYQHWWGSYILLILTLPILALSLAFLGWYFWTGAHKHHAHRRFLYYNIVGPFLFLALLWVFYLLLHNYITTTDMHHRHVEGQSLFLWR